LGVRDRVVRGRGEGRVRPRVGVRVGVEVING
jgi:hypothetical protein